MSSNTFSSVIKLRKWQENSSFCIHIALGSAPHLISRCLIWLVPLSDIALQFRHGCTLRNGMEIIMRDVKYEFLSCWTCIIYEHFTTVGNGGIELKKERERIFFRFDAKWLQVLFTLIAWKRLFIPSSSFAADLNSIFCDWIKENALKIPRKSSLLYRFALKTWFVCTKISSDMEKRELLTAWNKERWAKVLISYTHSHQYFKLRVFHCLIVNIQHPLSLGFAFISLRCLRCFYILIS